MPTEIIRTNSLIQDRWFESNPNFINEIIVNPTAGDGVTVGGNELDGSANQINIYGFEDPINDDLFTRKITLNIYALTDSIIERVFSLKLSISGNDTSTQTFTGELGPAWYVISWDGLWQTADIDSIELHITSPDLDQNTSFAIDTVYLELDQPPVEFKQEPTTIYRAVINALHS